MKSNISCPSCGSVTSPGDTTCSTCGESLAVISIPTEARRPPAVPETIEEKPAQASTASFCTKCGTKQSPENIFCPRCGNSINQNTAASGSKAAKIPQQKKAQTTSKQTGRNQSGKRGNESVTISKTAAAGIGFSFLAILLIMAAFSYFDTSTEKSVDQQSGPSAQKAPIDLEKIANAKRAYEENPGDQNAILAYANVLHDSRQPEGAIELYRKYLAIVPDNPDARVDMGACYFELKKFDEAITEMEIAVKSHPDHQMGNYNLGIVHLNAGKLEKAKEWFEKTIALDPQSVVGKNAKQIMDSQFK